MTADAQAVDDLTALSTVVLEGRLCSGRLPGFVAGIQRDEGHEPTYWARLIARRVAVWHAAGFRLSPEETATLLLMAAAYLRRTRAGSRG